MKKHVFLYASVVTLIGLLMFTSCKKEVIMTDPQATDNGFTSLQVPENFTWATSSPLKIDLKFVDELQNPVVATFEVVSKFPYGVKFMSGTSKSDGTFKKVYQVANHRTSFTILLPGQSPVEVVFGETEINEFPALEAKATIVVENTTLKSVMAETYEYYPAEGKYGTLCFEDNWPHEADYDFNDVVIDYNVIATLNDDLLVTKINMQLFLRASGANNHNGFGISFKHSWSFDGPYVDIASVTVNGNVVSAEATDYPSYILIQDIESYQPTYNSFMNQAFDAPTEFDVEIIFNTPAENWWELNFPLQNPFIIVNQERAREVHLPWYVPTSLADPDYVGKGTDASDPYAFDPNNFKAGNVVIGYYTYMTEEGYPWALNIYMDNEDDDLFLYPVEFADITTAYSSFEGWVEEGNPWEWYLPEYRVIENIYTKIPTPPYGE